ncbi:hypothetical protein MP638_005824 [Amoeboaphelidium occidentale]|nr:hypothetical protein MP638_005824 [Amoeboaphelidium occidentale]
MSASAIGEIEKKITAVEKQIEELTRKIKDGEIEIKEAKESLKNCQVLSEEWKYWSTKENLLRTEVAKSILEEDLRAERKKLESPKRNIVLHGFPNLGDRIAAVNNSTTRNQSVYGVNSNLKQSEFGVLSHCNLSHLDNKQTSVVWEQALRDSEGDETCHFNDSEVFDYGLVDMDQFREYQEDPLKAAQEALEIMANHGELHGDLKWEHVALWPNYCPKTKKYDLHPVLLDLTRTESFEPNAEKDTTTIVQRGVNHLKEVLLHLNKVA